MAKCKACGAQIIWRKTKAGEWMPLDEEPFAYEPNPDGKEILFDLNAEAIRCNIIERKPGESFDRIARRSHWATCPFADAFKKKKGGAKTC